jgi:hypothetical protein
MQHLDGKLALALFIYTKERNLRKKGKGTLYIGRSVGGLAEDDGVIEWRCVEVSAGRGGDLLEAKPSCRRSVIQVGCI